MAAHGLQQRFDHFHGKGAFVRLRSMLNDPRFAYQQIANKFGFTRQYIAQLAKGLGVDGTRRRQCERVLHRQLRVIKVEYPPSIRAVINKIRRSGNQVTPYVFPIQPSAHTQGNPFDAVVVGYYQDGRLLYAGKVRNGFVPHVRRELASRLKPLEINSCPFADLPEKKRTQWALTKEEMKKCVWLEPKLVAQIEFTEWTPDGHLRQSTFAGLRKDKDAKDIVRE